jgi:hypothetical protein
MKFAAFVRKIAANGTTAFVGRHPLILLGSLHCSLPSL